METLRRGAGPGTPTGSPAHWLQGDADALLQQSLNALLHGDANAAGDAARIALARADGPERDAYAGWAAWMLGLVHLYSNDSTGAAPYLARAQDLAYQSRHATLSMAVYLAQRLNTAYQQQVQWRVHARRLLKQIEEQDTKLTQEFHAMLKFARDTWPTMQPIPLPPGPAAPADATAGAPRSASRRLDILPPLQVQMLGPFRVWSGGHEISARQSRRAADVFKYMLAHRVRPTAKEALLQTYWVDVDGKTATHRLHVAVNLLRQMLGGAYVSYRDDAYFFNPIATIDTDVDRFLEYARQAQTLERAKRGAEAIAPYEAAVELYQDDYLIEDLYEEWTQPVRIHLRETYLAMLARLCEQYVQVGRFDDCLQAARKLLGKDNYREDAHRYVMICLHALGHRNQALRQYQICAELLSAELGVPPTTQTTALYLQIKNERQ